MKVASSIAVVVFLASVGQEARDATHLPPAEIRVLLRWLEALGDWSKEELARKAGMTRQTLWLYRTGDIAMGRHALRCLADGVGLPLWVIEGVMLPAIRAVRLVVEHARGEKLLAGWEGVLSATEQPVLVQDIRVSEILKASRHRGGVDGPSIGDRKLAEDKWRRLKDRSPA
ncbi:MAG TPA: helix-turn-helix transcriptional regulator, partial [Thermoanaerobaculia bacterium]|nr:helix-turn-helix transcriptional regulator [Thermoanaerobaculia bacterium]